MTDYQQFLIFRKAFIWFIRIFIVILITGILVALTSCDNKVIRDEHHYVIYNEELDSCQYIIIKSANGVAILHSNSCTNPKHKNELDF